MELHKGCFCFCLREDPPRGKTLEAEGIGARGIGAEGVEAGGIGARGIGAEGIGAGGIGYRAFQAPILGGTLDDPGKRCPWKKDASR